MRGRGTQEAGVGTCAWQSFDHEREHHSDACAAFIAHFYCEREGTHNKRSPAERAIWVMSLIEGLLGNSQMGKQNNLADRRLIG